MAPLINPVKSSQDYPAETEVTVIGGGIIGLVTALCLAEKGIPVVVLEKGRIAAEQSSRNLGWVRKLNRSREDVPLAIEAERLWGQIQKRTAMDVGYRQAGMMFVARNHSEMAAYSDWLDSVKESSIDAELLGPAEIDSKAPGSSETWVGGVYSQSDGYAEPTLASTAIAIAAKRAGAVLVENCAVRTLDMSAGRLSGVVTERGVMKCDQVLLAGGVWSRKFLCNLGISLPTLPVIGSAFRTGPIQGPTDMAVAASDFSFRKCRDGGYIIIQRGAFGAPLTLDHLILAKKFAPTLMSNRKNARLSFGRHFFEDLSRSRRWKSNQVSPFERTRIMDPCVDQGLVNEAMKNLGDAWPVFRNATIKEAWAGAIDITPDSMPVISRIPDIPGLTVATGFSGHGFGTSPAAGQLAADLILNNNPVVDPAPYRFDRF